MRPDEFKAQLTCCGSEMEVRRLVHYHYETIAGTFAELLDCLRAADARAMHFAAAEEGATGGAFVPVEVAA